MLHFLSESCKGSIFEVNQYIQASFLSAEFVKKQEVLHKTKTFREEDIECLKAHGIDVQEKYLRFIIQPLCGWFPNEFYTPHAMRSYSNLIPSGL